MARVPTSGSYQSSKSGLELTITSLDRSRYMPEDPELIAARSSRIRASPGAVAHHIVAFKARDASRTRAILARFGIGINDAANGVFLPATRAAPNPAAPNPTGAAVHSTLHTNQYYRTVNNLLVKATTRAEAEAILASIRQRLLSGGL